MVSDYHGSMSAAPSPLWNVSGVLEIGADFSFQKALNWLKI